MTTLYNKTNKLIVYVGNDVDVRLPAAAQNGQRGAAVSIDPIKKSTLTANWERVLKDFQDGTIEIVRD